MSESRLWLRAALGWSLSLALLRPSSSSVDRQLTSREAGIEWPQHLHHRLSHLSSGPSAYHAEV